MITKILTVFGLATFEIYAAIPAGFAMGLSAWVVFVASLLGGITGAWIAAFLGEKIKIFVAKYRKPKPKKVETNTLAHRIWNKYGIIGLGILGTFTIGAPISIAVGVGFNAPLKKLFYWCCVGVFARCLIFTTIGHFGKNLLT